MLHFHFICVCVCVCYSCLYCANLMNFLAHIQEGRQRALLRSRNNMIDSSVECSLLTHPTNVFVWFLKLFVYLYLYACICICVDLHVCQPMLKRVDKELCWGLTVQSICSGNAAHVRRSRIGFLASEISNLLTNPSSNLSLNTDKFERGDEIYKIGNNQHMTNCYIHRTYTRFHLATSIAKSIPS